MATVKIASIIAGSATAARVISRLLPMPAELAGGSSPPKARKNRPSAHQADHGQHASEQAHRARARCHRHHQPGAKGRDKQHMGREGEITRRAPMTMSLAQEFSPSPNTVPKEADRGGSGVGLPVLDEALSSGREQGAGARLEGGLPVD